MSSHSIEDAEIVHETFDDEKNTKAVLVEAPDFDEPTWVPYSVIHADSEVCHEGDKGDMLVKGWWADRQGLI